MTALPSRRSNSQLLTSTSSVPWRKTAAKRSRAQSPAEGTPWRSMYVGAAAVYLVLESFTPFTGFHCVPVRLTSTCCCGTTNVASLGGAPVPL